MSTTYPTKLKNLHILLDLKIPLLLMCSDFWNECNVTKSNCLELGKTVQAIKTWI